MSTWGDLITRSLVLAGVQDANQPAKGEKLVEGLVMVNDLLATYNLDKLLLPEITKESFTVTVGTAEYSFGSGGDISTTHPLKIFGREEWNRTPRKTDSGRPTGLYFHATFPLGSLKFDRQPAEADTCWLDTERPMSSIASVSTLVSASLPAHYRLPIIYVLALLISHEYRSPIDSEVKKEAAKMVKKLKALNLDISPVRLDAGIVRGNRNLTIDSVS